MSDYKITHHLEKKRFETEQQGLIAFVQYRLLDGGLDIIHTIVPRPLEGRGIAAALVHTAYQYAKDSGLKPLATCSYAVTWLKRHPIPE